MKNIPLREYVRDIENLIAKGKSAYAEQHCKHILHFYPKHVELYRLLGNACMDLEKTDEAGDVFQRLLSVIPDDFTALAGLGVIKEDQNDLDLAIWYMEKAGEVDPSNAAIQAEIRRLFLKRDGVSPERSWTTGGGLIRMYLKSNLFDQAIAKARSTLADDPQQIDIQLILARTYYHLGKRMEAAELCIQIVNVLPYCLEANKILFIVCSTMNRAAEAGVFQQRINEIDPYAAFISKNSPSASLVPDEAIMIELLDVPLKENDLYFRQSEEPAADLMRVLYSPTPPLEEAASEPVVSVSSQPRHVLDEVETASVEPASAEADEPAQPVIDTPAETSPAEILDVLRETSPAGRESMYREEDLPDWLKDFSQPAALEMEGIRPAAEEILPDAITDAPEIKPSEADLIWQAEPAARLDPSPVNEQEQVLAWLKNLEENEQKDADPLLINEFPSLSFGQNDSPDQNVEDADTHPPSDFSAPHLDDPQDLQAQLRSILMQDIDDFQTNDTFSFSNDVHHSGHDLSPDTPEDSGDTIDPEIG